MREGWCVLMLRTICNCIILLCAVLLDINVFCMLKRNGQLIRKNGMILRLIEDVKAEIEKDMAEWKKTCEKGSENE